jgi:hypothetical protein
MSEKMQENEKHDPEDLAAVPAQEGEVVHDDYTVDAVFGEITEDGPNYRNVRIPRHIPWPRLTPARLDGWERLLSC